VSALEPGKTIGAGGGACRECGVVEPVQDHLRPVGDVAQELSLRDV
jgi:hypothetical protein